VPAYASVLDVPDPVDLAVIVVPAKDCTDVIRACGERGIRTAIVFASGFSEVGPEGRAAEVELAGVAREAGVRIIGPNSVGAVMLGTGLTTTFMTGLDQDRFDPVDDGIAFVSQSGAMGGFILNMAQSEGVGVGRFISTGNEADLTISDLMAGLIEEGSTKVVLGYVEGIRDGGAFSAALAEGSAAGLPVVIMKVGRSERGAAAASSHTGALAGSDIAFDAVLRAHGAHRANDIEHLLDLGRVFVAGRLPRGNRVSIVTLSGGAGVLLTDYAEDLGLDVFPWDDVWQQRLAEILPSFAALGNPIDTTGAIAADSSLLTKSLDIAVQNPDTDLAILLLGNLECEEEELCEAILQAVQTTDKPVLVCWVGGSGRPQRLLARAGVPTFADPYRTMRAAAALIAEASHRHTIGGDRGGGSVVAQGTLGGPSDLLAAQTDADPVLDEHVSKLFLLEGGVPIADEVVASDADGAVEAARVLGHPVVVKLLAEGLAHKSELGVVHLGLGSDDAVRRAAEHVLGVADEQGVSGGQVLVQQQVAGSTELILGMYHDEVFGPMTLLGMGGVFTELMRDVQVRPAPVDHAQAKQMIDGLAMVDVLRGARGRQAVDEQVLADVVVAFSRHTAEFADRLDSVDVNPLIVNAEGRVIAVDAVVTLVSVKEDV
jgi:acyl-CoA synthetase (NDP forming)